MHTRIQVKGRLPLIFMIWTFMVCGASWQYYGDWVDVTNDPQLVNAAKQAAIDENRPILMLYSRSGSDCSHCKALWQGALCDGGDKCAGASCPLSDSGHPWSDYARKNRIILLYVNLSQVQDWFTYFKKQHMMTYSGAYPVYAIFHVKETADCETTTKATILNASNVDCIGASYYSVGSRINGVKLENSFDSFKELFESYFAEGMETYGLTLTAGGGGQGGDVVLTAQFEAAEYTVSADAPSIDIPVIVTKKSYLAGGINVPIKLDNSSFGKGNKVVVLKGGKQETTLAWTAAENPGNGDLSPKTVAVYLHDADNAKYWKGGVVERTVTLTIAEGGMVEPVAGHSTVIIHIVNDHIVEDNPYIVAGTRLSGTLLDDEETVGVMDMELVENKGELLLKAAVRGVFTVDGKKVNVKTEFSTSGWDEVGDDGIATVAMSRIVKLNGKNTTLGLTVKIDKDGCGVDGCQLVVRLSATEEEIACYKLDMTRNATAEEIQALWPYYTVALNPCETEDAQGHGGMMFNVDTQTGEVSYHGFLPDGVSEFEGTAFLRYVFEIEEYTYEAKEYGEFTVFVRTHSAKDWRDEWFGGVVRIDLNANGKGRICVQCRQMSSRGDDDEYLGDCMESAIWYRAGGKLHFNFSGGKFERNESLSAQLSKGGPFVNLYYLVAENPLQTPGGESSLMTPQGFRMVEDDESFTGEASIFGVALSFGVSEQGGADGTFSGRMKIYSMDYEDTNCTREVAVKGVLMGANADCCSAFYFPVGYGYFIVEGTDGQAVSCGVKIIWGGSLLLDDEIEEWLDDAIKPKLPPLDAVGYGGVEAHRSDLEGVLLSADGNSLAFKDACETIAVDGDGTAVWIGMSWGVALPAGEWDVYRIDMSGENRESDPLRLTLTDSVACRLEMRPGWNLLSIPWAAQELAWDQETLFHEQYKGHIFTADGDNYVAYDGALTAGCAYWVYADRRDTVTLYAAMDDTEAEAKKTEVMPENDAWFFGVDPGVEWRSAGMIWSGRKFVSATDDIDGAAGWWHINKK